MNANHENKNNNFFAKRIFEQSFKKFLKYLTRHDVNLRHKILQSKTFLN